MSAGETIVWCCAIVCVTILAMLGIIMWGYQRSDGFNKN